MEDDKNQIENFPLDEETANLLAEYDKQAAAANIASEAILSLFLRRHKLQGQWQVAPNRRELVKAAQPQAPISQG